ncbi:MAG: glycoside hydrolase family 127 protein [Verrucomicrobiales bacterium]|nr:glycoside hydrolase family 127 protein [Verrucomicrobiales bacterium]
MGLCQSLWMSVVLCAGVGCGLMATAAEQLEAPDPASVWAGRQGKIQPVPVRQVRLEGGFWGPKLQIYRERTIPHSWQYMGHNLRSLRKAAGVPTVGPFNGTWDEANLHKFIETIAHSLGIFPDPALEQKVDEIVDLLARAQRPNGYAHVYIINEGKPEWDPEFLDGSHDGYVLGHLIEAAIEYHANTGKRALLDIACKAADEAYDHFLGPRGVPGFCGHAELEMALVELARVTGRARYVELAKAWVEWRGRGVVKPFGDTPRSYFQDHVPLRQQRVLDGHAVRSTFFATGVADLALATGDADYRLAANRFWDSVTLRRMTITGSTGPRQEHEAFGEDFDLPNHGYYESCAACGLMDFAQRMFLLEGGSDTGDVLERVLYNAVLHGISLDGTNSYYQNPLSDTNRARYNSWVCCPPNLSRTLFQVGRYAYASGGREAYVNLYVNGTAQLPMEGATVGLKVETKYPWDGRVSFRVLAEEPARFALNLRWPGWCESATLSINGTPVRPLRRSDRGFVRLEREWRANDEIVFLMDMPVQRVEAHPRIQGCVGKVALQRGPVVYGFEGVDNDGRAAIELPEHPVFRVEARDDLLGGIQVITGQDAEQRAYVAIPFYALANRAKSVQEVWVAQRDWKPGETWWEGRLYRNAGERKATAVAPSPTEKDAR